MGRPKRFNTDDVKFRRLFDQQLNPGIDPRGLKTTDKTKITIRLSEHVNRTISVKSFCENTKAHI